MPERPGLRRLLLALGRRRARTRGALRIAGLRAPLRIDRDRWGIPHIQAANDHDAWFGLGFSHGQDRGWQLELLARAGRGTLSEVLGAAALPIDRLSRTLGFARLAPRQLAVLDADVRATLEAYVAGVNAAGTVTPRPHELVLLRAPRSAWRVDDVITFMGLQSLALAGSWDTELARLRILLADGADALRRAEHPYASWLPVTDPPDASFGPAVDRLAVDLERLRSLAGGAGASNAWAVAGGRTASGAPILANDPHLAPAVPGPWYLAHLATPEWSMAGASFVGSPTIPSGHNGRVAWGITAACTDSADLFWEEVDLEAGTASAATGSQPIQVVEERIAVRGGDEHVERVAITPRGPIVTPLLDGITMALSFRATWLEPAPVRGFLDVCRATSVDEVEAAFRAWPGPGLNLVTADARGRIAWRVIGSLPRRGSGFGMLPEPAWDPEIGWLDGHVPFDAMPAARDPGSGFVASANHTPRPDGGDDPFVGVDWLDGYRAARIIRELGRRSDWDVPATMALQTDVVAGAWRELAPLVMEVEPTDPDARIATRLLRDWHGALDIGSSAASVYEALVAELAERLARESAPTAWRWVLGAGVGDAIPRTTFAARYTSRVVAALRDRVDRAALVEGALAASVQRVRRRAGPDVARWGWGVLRPLRLRHALGAQRPLDRVFDLGPIPLGGDTNTVAQAGVSPLDPFANPAAIPNQRTVVDLGDPDRSRYVLAGGQSGNPLSPHYADLLALWRRGAGVPIAWSSDAVAAAVVDRLGLDPAE
jgi:penicillin G amidase